MKKKPSGDRKKEKFFSDYDGFSVDSYKLQYLIEGYENEIEKAKRLGMKVFWRRARELNEENFRPSNRITDVELSLIRKALRRKVRNDSIKAIQSLIESNPQVVSLPFVYQKIIDVLHEYKASSDSKRRAEIRLVTWPGFLPDRTGSKTFISDESLERRIKQFREMPVDQIINVLEQCKDLQKRGFITGFSQRGLSSDDLTELIRTVRFDKKGSPRKSLTKELACRIIKFSLPVSSEKVRNIKILERSGRPRK